MKNTTPPGNAPKENPLDVQIICRIVLVDDHEIVRSGIRLLIESTGEMIVVGEGSTVADAMPAIAIEKPDVVLMDLWPGAGWRVDAADRIHEVSPTTHILVLTGNGNVDDHEHAVRNGAKGIVLKSSPAATLFTAIKKICAGEAWIDRTLVSRLLSNKNRDGRGGRDGQRQLQSLTVREVEIVRLISEGLVNKDIGSRLFISEKTVRNHLTAIYSKLGVTTRLGLAVYITGNPIGQDNRSDTELDRS